MRRILLYSHDSYGLGHLRRVLTVAEALAARDPSAALLCVTGSPRPDLFHKPPRCDHVKLPSVTKDAAGAYVARRLPLALADALRVRGEIITATARSFRPDFILVDHAARGLAGELDRTLAWVAHARPRPRLVLGLRDIVDDPERARAQFARESTIEAIRAFYDAVLVYGERRLFDAAKEYALPPDVRAKLHYVGLVCAQRRPARPAPPAGRPARLLVCAGGGGDGYPLLRATLAALSGPLRREPLEAEVVAGPFLSTSKFERLLHAAGRRSSIRVVRAVPDLHEVMADVDLVVAMGGYNTVYEALAAGRRLLVRPRVQPRQEQYERARRLERLGLVRTLAWDDLQDPARLAGRIREALASEPPNPAARGLRLDGAERAAAALLGLRLRRGAAAAREREPDYAEEAL